MFVHPVPAAFNCTISAEIEFGFETSIEISSKYTQLFPFVPGFLESQSFFSVSWKLQQTRRIVRKSTGWISTTITRDRNHARSLKGGVDRFEPSRWPQTPQSLENHQPQKIDSRMNKLSRCLYHCVCHTLFETIAITMMERRAKFYSFIRWPESRSR